MKAQRQVGKLTLAQEKSLRKVYENSIENLARQVSRDGSLTKRARENYLSALRNDLDKLITAGVEEASKIGVGTTIEVLKIDTFPRMFSQVNDKTIRSILKGGLYKDNTTLSDRIWNYGKQTGDELQSIISQGLLERKSAVELAKDLEQFVLPPARRPSDWGKVYPNLKYKKVDYNAMRLARTSINHSFQTSTIASSELNPYTTGIKWHSALIHGRTCDLCRERHGTVFSFGDVPLDHPNGLCTMIPEVEKSLDEIADELYAWQNGKSIPYLDRLLE